MNPARLDDQKQNLTVFRLIRGRSYLPNWKTDRKTN
jgi:hypothetical protein